MMKMKMRQSGKRQKILARRIQSQMQRHSNRKEKQTDIQTVRQTFRQLQYSKQKREKGEKRKKK